MTNCSLLISFEQKVAHSVAHHHSQAQPGVECHEDHHHGVGEGHLHQVHKGQEQVSQGAKRETFPFYFPWLFRFLIVNSYVLRVSNKSFQKLSFHMK